MLVDPKTILIELLMQAIFSGLYLASLVHCLRWLVFADEGWEWREKINWPMLIVTILVFALTTLEFAIIVKWELHYVWYDTRYYQNPVEQLLMNMNPFIIVLIVDAILIYRCWVVYAGSWRVTSLPIIFWIASLVFSIDAIYNDRIAYSALQGGMFWPRPRNVTIGFIGFALCNIATDIYATFAIVYRILSVAQASSHCQRLLRNTAHILAESGTLYTVVTVVYVVGLFGKENSSGHGFQRVFAAISLAMAGIGFHLVVIRTSQNRVNWGDGYAGSQNANRQKRLSTLLFHTTTSHRHSSISMASEQSLVEEVGKPEAISGSHPVASV